MHEPLTAPPSPAPATPANAAPRARYMDSVPLLQSQDLFAGYCWITHHPALADLPPGVTYIAALPTGGLLITTETLSTESLHGLPARPWPLQLYNDAQETAPFAVLGDDGRYAQLETFGLEKQVVETQETIYFCKFLCGSTTGETHVCAQ